MCVGTSEIVDMNSTAELCRKSFGVSSAIVLARRKFMLLQILWLFGLIAVVSLVLWGLGQFEVDPMLYKFVRVLAIVGIGIYIIFMIIGFVGAFTPAFPFRR